MKDCQKYYIALAIALLSLLNSCAKSRKSNGTIVNECIEQTSTDKYKTPTFVQTNINTNDTIFGCIFGKDSDIQIPFNYSDRFTPSEDDILLAENIIANNFQRVIEDCRLRTDTEDISSTSDNLLYFRQYVGYTAIDGSKRIFINCIRFRSLEERQSISEDTELFLVEDGGAKFWETTINLTDSTIFDIKVHELG